VLEVGRALGPQIDNDVEDGAARASHQLARRLGYWKCMPRSVPFLRSEATLAWAITGLSPWSRNSFWQKAREEAPLVRLAVEIDDEDVFKLCFGEDHGSRPV
jgi:hypothetical protein